MVSLAYERTVYGADNGLLEAGNDYLRREQINAVIAVIDALTREILAAFREKNGLCAAISARLDLLSHVKASLGDSSIDSIAKFAAYSEKQHATLREGLAVIESGDDLRAVKRALLHIDADYDVIYRELCAIYVARLGMLARLNSFVNRAREILDIL